MKVRPCGLWMCCAWWVEQGAVCMVLPPPLLLVEVATPFGRSIALSLTLSDGLLTTPGPDAISNCIAQSRAELQEVRRC